jgi:hypothetical protein
MLLVTTNRKSPEEIEIEMDSQGIDDLISYLEGIKKQKDHMHLFFGSELDDIPMSASWHQDVVVIKAVRLQYSEQNSSEGI